MTPLRAFKYITKKRNKRTYKNEKVKQTHTQKHTSAVQSDSEVRNDTAARQEELIERARQARVADRRVRRRCMK